MRLAVLLVAAASLAAGCALPAPGAQTAGTRADVAFADLASTATETIQNDDGSVSHVFEATSRGGAELLVTDLELSETPLGTFDVDARVGFVELDFVDTEAVSVLGAVLLDEGGRIQCVAFVDAPCTVPVPADTVGARTWAVDDRPVIAAARPGAPIRATVTLHPPSHMFVGDPLAGLDPSVRFRVSDTGVPGSEDNIGLLGDGTILTAKGTSIMRSRDDGVTWENVAPPGNDRVSFDPMLFVDSWRGTVYVDHLTIACSTLSWSSDAGESWLTNPTACGLPANDHQKIAAGPSPVPGSPLAAVYYSFTSFAHGSWVSRSYDGGLTWTPANVIGVTDPMRRHANTGPVFADEQGNVFVPYYLCDDGGSMAVGVSHDHGLTYKLVIAAEHEGPCYDVDPGLWSDTAGNVYLAYHRPDGVHYVASTDAGETWSAPVKVSPPSLLSFVHVDMVAGDEGRIAIVYRATPDSAKGPDGADGWAAWHLYVSLVEDALGPAPVVRTGIVNDPAVPVQRGPICTGGVLCYGGSRNLLDFIDIAVGPDGRVYPTYTSGCSDACPTPADSRLDVGLVGIQEEGPRLFVARAPWAA